MSFEEDQIEKCRECLKETERKYGTANSVPTTPSTPSDHTPTWYSSVRSLFGGSSAVDKVCCYIAVNIIHDCFQNIITS